MAVQTCVDFSSEQGNTTSLKSIDFVLFSPDIYKQWVEAAEDLAPAAPQEEQEQEVCTMGWMANNQCKHRRGGNSIGFAVDSATNRMRRARTQMVHVLLRSRKRLMVKGRRARVES